MLRVSDIYDHAFCKMLKRGRRWCALKTYVYSVVSFSLALGILLLLVPDGVRQGLKKHVKFIGVLCLLCVLINPATALIESLEELLSGDPSIIFGEPREDELYAKYEDIYQSYLDGSYGENVGDAVKDSLFEKFGIKKESCRVLTELSDNDGDGVRTPQKITVVLSGADRFRDPEAIKEFVAEVFGCDSAVALE